MPSSSRERHQNESASIASSTDSGNSDGSNDSGSESVGTIESKFDEIRFDNGDAIAATWGERRYGRTDVSGEKYLKEGRDEIIDPLHIATGRMPYCPHVQDAFQALEQMHELAVG